MQVRGGNDFVRPMARRLVAPTSGVTKMFEGKLKWIGNRRNSNRPRRFEFETTATCRIRVDSLVTGM